MSRWSSSVLNPESSSDVIRLEESGTISLNDSLNQLSNVIDPATWNESSFSLVKINVYAIFQWDWI